MDYRRRGNPVCLIPVILQVRRRDRLAEKKLQQARKRPSTLIMWVTFLDSNRHSSQASKRDGLSAERHAVLHKQYKTVGYIQKYIGSLERRKREGLGTAVKLKFMEEYEHWQQHTKFPMTTTCLTESPSNYCSQSQKLLWRTWQNVTKTTEKW